MPKTPVRANFPQTPGRMQNHVLAGLMKVGSGIVLHDLFLNGSVFRYSPMLHAAPKNRRDWERNREKEEACRPSIPDVFRCKAHASRAPARPCCHALCFRWDSNARAAHGGFSARL